MPEATDDQTQCGGKYHRISDMEATDEGHERKVFNYNLHQYPEF